MSGWAKRFELCDETQREGIINCFLGGPTTSAPSPTAITPPPTNDSTAYTSEVVTQAEITTLPPPTSTTPTPDTTTPDVREKESAWPAVLIGVGITAGVLVFVAIASYMVYRHCCRGESYSVGSSSAAVVCRPRAPAGGRWCDEGMMERW